MEEFKRIKGFKNLYLISNYGRVIKFYKSGRQIELKQYKQHNDYLVVHLWDGHGNRKKMRVNRLVAAHFIPDGRTEFKTQVHHLNNDIMDNKVWNLKWETQVDNLRGRSFS